MIGLVTFHRAINYGAVLQAYALEKVLNEKLGKNTEIVDLINTNVDKAYKVDLLKLPKSISDIKKQIISFTSFKSNKMKEQKFKEFVNKNIKISKRYTSLNIYEANQKYCKFITGSDQVFNIDITGENLFEYLLGFVSSQNKKYSYAASIGKTRLSRQEEKIFKQYLKDYEKISIREEGSKELLNSLIPVSVNSHIDPTLLIDRNEWNKLCIRPKYRFKYLLVYAVGATSELYVRAREIARKNNLKVLFIGTGLKKRIQYPEFKFIADAGPSEFLSLIAGAEMVLTSSFHGTALSIIFEKKFISLLNPDNEKNERIISILEKLDLMNCIEWEGIVKEERIYNICWKEVKQRLEVHKQIAYSYLSEI